MLSEHQCDFSNPAGCGKFCAGCRTVRPFSSFIPSPASPDGLTAKCKPCIWNASASSRQERERRLASARAR
jgi:hypothetical protein